MEEILDVYEMEYDPLYPTVCFDERPCQLIGDIVLPIPMKSGKVLRQDYHYRRNGTCCVLMAVEPLAGKRIVVVKKQRTKKDYAYFMKELEKTYHSAKKIRVIQDNLNTHNPSSFYEAFPPEYAFWLTHRFEMIYTPKKASWLNIAETELSVLAKQCLDRRIGDIKTFSREVSAWAKERNRREAKVCWQFTKNAAREKLGRHYVIIRN